MNVFESTLASALHDEAQEMAMSTDLNDGREILDNRLDDVDRGRRRWQVVGGLVAAAAAAAVALAAVAVLGRSAPPPAMPVEPATGPLFRATGFQPAFSANLPAWVAEVMTSPTEQTADTVTWNRCEERPACIGLDAYTIRYLTRGSTEPATYADYLARMEELRRAGAIDVTDSRQTTVIGGRPLPSTRSPTNGDTADGMGCFTTLRCQDFYTDNLARYAVVDTGSAPLVIGMRTFVENPQGPVWIDQLGGMLATLRMPEPDRLAVQESSPGRTTRRSPSPTRRQRSPAAISRRSRSVCSTASGQARPASSSASTSTRRPCGSTPSTQRVASRRSTSR